MASSTTSVSGRLSSARRTIRLRSRVPSRCCNDTGSAFGASSEVPGINQTGVVIDLGAISVVVFICAMVLLGHSLGALHVGISWQSLGRQRKEERGTFADAV